MIYAALTLFIMVSGFRSPCKICRIPIEKKRYIGNNYFINLPFKKEPLAAHWTVCVNAKIKASILERLGYNHAWHKLHLLAVGLKVLNPGHLDHNKSWDFSGEMSWELWNGKVSRFLISVAYMYLFIF